MNLVYFCGPPAAGKSTLMAKLTEACLYVARAKPIPHNVLVNGITGYTVGLYLGKRREQFPGTDTLAMNISPKAKEFARSLAPTGGVLLGEGDRLGFPGFIGACAEAGMDVTLVHLTASGRVLDERCEQRGSGQDATWRKGRATKAANLAAWASSAGLRVVTLDTSAAVPAALVKMLRSDIPALKVIPGRR